MAWTWALAEDDARRGLLRSGGVTVLTGGADRCRAATDVVVVVVVVVTVFDVISGVLAPAPPGMIRLGGGGRLTVVDADLPSAPSWGGEEDAIVGDVPADIFMFMVMVLLYLRACGSTGDSDIYLSPTPTLEMIDTILQGCSMFDVQCSRGEASQ